MRFSAVWGFLFAACIAACGESPEGAPPTVTYNPYTVLPIERPGDGAIDIADPTVIKVDGRWYLYGTSNPKGFEVWSSSDLATWTYGGLVWQPTAGTWNDRGNYWAPHVQAAPEGFYLYYTANGQIGLAFSTSPGGQFTDVMDHPFAGGGHGGIAPATTLWWPGPQKPTAESPCRNGLSTRRVNGPSGLGPVAIPTA
jgi:hypothetical protein